jgi:salicylate hydroxylase
MLARAGRDVRVFERAATFSEVGAGLQLSPNVSRIARGLGLDAILDPVLGKPEALVVRRAATAAVIIEMPLGDVAERRWGAPTWVAHRADLQAALLEALRGESGAQIETATTVLGFAETASNIRVRLSSPSGDHQAEGQLLIAADGVRSNIRAQWIGASPARYSGFTAFRATVAIDLVPLLLRRNATGLWLGPGAHLVHYPLRGGALVNIVAIVADARAGEGWDAAAQPDEVMSHFADWAEPARELVAQPASWARWALYDRSPDPTWPSSGRVTLLGDAAHPMLPFLAQGAAMAIEDAAVLTRCLSDPRHDVAGALARYRAERAPRVGRVQTEARRNGEIFHLSGPLALVRDAGLAVIGPGGLMARYDWLYGFEV